MEKREKDVILVVEKIQRELDEDRTRQKPYRGVIPTIFKVAEHLRKVNPSAYTPRLVSIGPIHRRDEIFQPSHQRKVSRMQELISRTSHLTGTPKHETLDACAKAVHSRILEIRQCYAVNLTSYTDSDLVEMMVVDGCFILELFYIFYAPVVPVPHVDPVIHNILVTFDVKRDLTLLENQIPFFVLQGLFEHTIKKFSQSISLTRLVVSFFQDVNVFKGRLELRHQPDENPHHVLGLLQRCFWPAATERNIDLSEASRPYSAMELARAGVVFDTYNSREWKLAVKFQERSWFEWLCAWRKPVLKIPVLRVVDSTEYFLRNLIAYEHCSPTVHHYVASYASLMDALIDTREDVDLLVKTGVVENKLGNTEEVVNLINNLGKEIVYRESYYAEQGKRIEKHCNRFMPKTIARLRRTYFSNPWSSISVFAALILFALTIVQTYFTVQAA